MKFYLISFKGMMISPTVNAHLYVVIGNILLDAFFFERITRINEEKIDFLSRTFSVYQNDSYGQSPGNYVKIVDCSFLCNEFDWKSLDKLFPFIEVIETDQNMVPLHNQLYRLLKEGMFPYLKILPTNVHNIPPPELIFQRKEIIEELHLYAISFEDQVYQNLHLFPRLKVLHLYYPYEVRSKSFFSKEIQQLKSINFSCENHYRNFNTSLLNLNCIQPFINIREIAFNYNHLFSDGELYLIYIMKKFPNLDSLEIFSANQCINSSIQNCFGKGYCITPTMGCMFQFLVYLFKMKCSNVDCMITDGFTSQIVIRFLSYVFDQKTVHYKNIEVSIQVSFHFVKRGEEHNYSLDRTAYIGLQNQKAGYKYNKYNVCNLSVNYKVMQESTFQSHLDLIREVAHMDITFLQVGNHSLYLRNNIRVALDDVFIHLAKLKELTFICINNFTWNKEEYIEKTLNLIIERIVFDTCTLSRNTFIMISEKCLNLKYLEIINCQNANYNGDHDDSRIVSIMMQSTRLQELQIIIDNRRGLGNFPYKKAFIRLLTNKKKPRYCKIITNIQPPIISFPEQDCTEAHYKLCLDDEECAVFDIHCEAVIKLFVNVETDFYESYEYNYWNDNCDEDNELDSCKEREYPEENM